MKTEIKGEDLLVYCANHKEVWKFIEVNKIKRQYTGAFNWKDYSGTSGHNYDGSLTFWFLPEHLSELKFN